jgi:hypothetical protein
MIHVIYHSCQDDASCFSEGIVENYHFMPHVCVCALATTVC